MICIKIINFKKKNGSSRPKNKIIRIIKELNRINNLYKKTVNIKDLINELLHLIFCIFIKKKEEDKEAKDVIEVLVEQLNGKTAKLRCKNSGFKINQKLSQCIRKDLLKVVQLITMLKRGHILYVAFLLTNFG
jgi:hypothetical protein